MKKLISKLPIICFIAMIVTLYFDNKRHSDKTVFLIILFLALSIVSFTYLKMNDYKADKLNKPQLVFVLLGVIASIIVAVYFLSQN